MNGRTRPCSGVALILALVWAPAVSAGPWLAPGDLTIRHDLELIDEAGLITIPISTWPLSWGDVSRALNEVTSNEDLDPALAAAINRLRERAAAETDWGWVKPKVRLSGAEKPRRIRTFEDTPRGSGEARGGIAYTGENFATQLQVGMVANAEDGQNFRLDGSFVAFVWRNQMVSLGLQDKWWGPGWAGSLALSSNARPIPGILIQRNFSDPFAAKWLRWIGPWTYSAFVGQLESDRAVPNAFLLGGRVVFRPLRHLEVGVTRTAQWGGDGRPQDLESLFDLFFGRDNRGEGGVTLANEPGNQLGGFDWRWTFLRGRRPATFYGQLIGEDEAGGLPSRYLGQLGLTTSGPIGERGASYRMRLEYSDTTCQFHESSRIFDCAYTSGIYRSGYRYRGRSIGHSTDADSRQVALSGTVIDGRSRSLSAMARVADLNRGGAPDPENKVASVPKDLINIELTYAQPLAGGRAEIGVGYDEVEDSATGRSDSSTRVFLQWTIQ